MVGNGKVTVAGYDAVKIAGFTPAKIDFDGTAKSNMLGTIVSSSIHGSIDRNSGRTNMTITQEGGPPMSYKLMCKSPE